MILSDVSLRAHLDARALVVEPLGENAIQPASIDLRLGSTIKRQHPTPAGGWFWLPIDIPDGYCLYPGTFVLGTTMETVKVPDFLLGILHGRSSVGRTGLQVECAGLIDPGFLGEITLELVNLGNEELFIKPGMPIGQLTFHWMTTAAERPYGSPGVGKYQGQIGPTQPR